MDIRQLLLIHTAGQQLLQSTGDLQVKLVLCEPGFVKSTVVVINDHGVRDVTKSRAQYI